MAKLTDGKYRVRSARGGTTIIAYRLPRMGQVEFDAPSGAKLKAGDEFEIKGGKFRKL